MSFQIEKIFPYKAPDRWLYVLIMLVWVPAIGRLLNAVFLRIPVFSVIGSEMQHVATAFAALASWQYLKDKIKFVDGIFYLFCFCVYLFSYAIYPQNATQLNKYFVDVLVLSIPAFYVGLVWDINKFDKFLYAVSFFSICYSAYTFLIYVQNVKGGFEEEEYHMGASYALLPQVLYITWHLLRKFRIDTLCVFLLGVFMLLSFGTRGPLICFLTFIVLFSLFLNDAKYKKTIIVCVFVVYCLIIYFLEPILLFFSELLPSLGMSDRIFTQMLLDEVLDDSGRGLILRTLENEMQYAPWHGYGLFGTYRFVNAYAHRIDIDFLFSFGVIFGSALLFILFVLIVKAFIESNKTEKGFLLILFCSSIVKLMFSGLYLFDTLFFLMLGFCISSIRKSFISSKSISFLDNK